jgi:hypothetical protein
VEEGVRLLAPAATDFQANNDEAAAALLLELWVDRHPLAPRGLSDGGTRGGGGVRMRRTIAPDRTD